MEFASRAKTLEHKPAPPGFKIIREGNGVMLFPAANQVFYNNVQVLNRDLSIAMISDFARTRAREQRERLVRKAKIKDLELQKQREQEEAQGDDAAAATVSINASADEDSGNAPVIPEEWSCEEQLDEYLQETANESGIKIFEALAASGLRSIRYFQQIPGVKSILVNDMDAAAVESIRRNVEFNELPIDRVIPNHADATEVMYQHRKDSEQFDVIDLDPYGSASIFLDGAVQSIANGGLLCVTCTDMAVLSGKNPEVCYSRYGSVPAKANYLHEMALRMVLHAIETSASRYQRHIVPIASCSIDFYVRVFVRIFKSPVKVKQAMTKRSHVFQCVNCDSFHLQPIGGPGGAGYQAARGPVVPQSCDQCGGKFKIAGPFWSAPIHDRDVVARIRDRVAANGKEFPTKDRLHGLLTTIHEEIPDAPLYYTVPGLCKTLHCSNPRMPQLQGAIRAAGYEAAQFHKVPDAIKTTAPNDVIWDIMRCWVQKHPLNKKREGQSTPGSRILAQEPKLEADFAHRSAPADKPKALRFPQNPEPNWGPKSRAVGNKAKQPIHDSNGQNDNEGASVKRTKTE